MDAKERARRFREYQELVSKVVKQQEDIKKKCGGEWFKHSMHR